MSATLSSYNIDIIERVDRIGFFVAKVRDWPIEEYSRDPKHDICHVLAERDFPDGPVQFWRDGMPTLNHSSIHAMGKRRIGLDQRFPYQRPKRSTFDWDRRASAAGGLGDE